MQWWAAGSGRQVGDERRGGKVRQGGKFERKRGFGREGKRVRLKGNGSKVNINDWDQGGKGRILVSKGTKGIEKVEMREREEGIEEDRRERREGK